MADTLRLLYGDDKRNPIDSLDLAGDVANGQINLRDYQPQRAPEEIIWSGRSRWFDGEYRDGSSRGNVRQSITTNLYTSDGSKADLQRSLAQLDDFAERVRQYEEQGDGQAMWLEYSPHDGLNLVRPSLGNRHSYRRIYDIAVPNVPLMHIAELLAGQIENVVTNLTCGPFVEGLRQQLFNGVGYIQQTRRGLLIGPVITNLITNPSFGHSTYTTGWAAEAQLAASQSTQRYHSLGSAVLLTSLTGVAGNFTVTLTLTAANYIISGYGQRIDGQPLTDADVSLVGQGGNLTATVDSEPDDRGFYRFYASYTAAASSSTHGVRNPGDQTILIDDLQIALASISAEEPMPFVAGNILGCAWAGTVHASNSTSAAGKMSGLIVPQDAFTDEFTTVIWLRPEFAATNVGGNALAIWQYYIDSSNFITLNFNESSGKFRLRRNRQNINLTLDVTGTFARHDDIMLTIVMNNTGGKIYINDSQAGSASGLLPGYVSGGTLYIGNDQGGSQIPFPATYDGLQLFNQALSAAEVDALYNQQAPVKARGLSISNGIPCWWTRAGNGVLENVNDDNVPNPGDRRRNFGIGMGIPGTTEALTEIQLTPPTISASQRNYYLGLKQIEYQFDIFNVLYGEFSGAASTSAFSGAAYLLTASGTSTFVAFVDKNLVTPEDARAILGRWQMLGHTRAATQIVQAYPGYALGNNETRFFGKRKNQPITTGFMLFNFGELRINPLFRDHVIHSQTMSNFIEWGIKVERPNATAHYLDFLQLLPYPFCRLNTPTGITIPSNAKLIVIGTRAYHFLSSGQMADPLFHEGAAINLKPQRYNYFFLIQGDETATATGFSATEQVTVEFYITPRWLNTIGTV